ncbi:hypothetical protein [Acanthopleuribacter pedis]|uniref:Uncharacterized protein n=1 Tax=Acanthopleuribacter pedis TaxID=442870 RepID=A0A8J7Q410_9BACT|nr:hypothetical protein [Acanthopleuribacter pedis]MBO1320167.1 hypothetical protein [Acanthopleuribacter pedis]
MRTNWSRKHRELPASPAHNTMILVTLALDTGGEQKTNGVFPHGFSTARIKVTTRR